MKYTKHAYSAQVCMCVCASSAQCLHQQLLRQFFLTATNPAVRQKVFFVLQNNGNNFSVVGVVLLMPKRLDIRAIEFDVLCKARRRLHGSGACFTHPARPKFIDVSSYSP